MKPKNWLEWTVFAVGAVLVCGVIGFLVDDQLHGGNQPAEVAVRLGEARPQGGQWVVPLTVHNQGDRTAEDVQVEIALLSGGEETGRAELQVAFLPRRATRRGWVAFREDPRLPGRRLVPRVLGYEEP